MISKIIFWGGRKHQYLLVRATHEAGRCMQDPCTAVQRLKSNTGSAIRPPTCRMHEVQRLKCAETGACIHVTNYERGIRLL
jgi:hypothetical protein